MKIDYVNKKEKEFNEMLEKNNISKVSFFEILDSYNKFSIAFSSLDMKSFYEYLPDEEKKKWREHANAAYKFAKSVDSKDYSKD